MVMVKNPHIKQLREAKFFIKMLVYGDNGAGKTVFGASAMDCDVCKEVLFVNIEGGMLSISKRKTLEHWDIIEFSEIKEVLRYLQEEEHPYKCVVLDSVTELMLRSLDAIVRDAMAAPPRGKPRTDEDEIRIDDYGKNTQAIRKVLRDFRDLPMHVIMTALAIESKDEEGVITVAPQLTEKLRNSVMGYVDIVAYMHVKKIAKEGKEELIRSFLFQPYGKYRAKDRTPDGKMGDFLVGPTVQKIMDLANSKLKPTYFSSPVPPALKEDDK